MIATLDYLTTHLWWPIPALIAAGAVGAGIGHLLNRGRRT